MSFQGTYAFRSSDGSTLLDSYIHGLSAERPVIHETLAMLKGRLESVTLVPDLSHSAQVMVENGGPSSLRKPGSPESILYFWYFKTLRNLDGRGYEFLGWEEVDGHRCIKVKIGRRQSAATAASTDPRVELMMTGSLYWIDLARGGHPLRVEHYAGEHLTSRIDKIRLEQVATTDQKRVWLPFHGEIGTFRWKRDQYYDSPVLLEACTILLSSARVNDRISDAIFTVKGGRSAFEDAKLRQARLEFEKIKPKPLPRTDPEGVKQDIDRKLAEADRQEKQLEASSAAREAAFWTPVTQLSIAAFGVVALASALVLRRRAG